MLISITSQDRVGQTLQSSNGSIAISPAITGHHTSWTPEELRAMNQNDFLSSDRNRLYIVKVLKTMMGIQRNTNMQPLKLHKKTLSPYNIKSAIRKSSPHSTTLLRQPLLLLPIIARTSQPEETALLLRRPRSARARVSARHHHGTRTGAGVDIEPVAPQPTTAT